LQTGINWVILLISQHIANERWWRHIQSRSAGPVENPNIDVTIFIRKPLSKI
jgi:hypothetical protein